MSKITTYKKLVIVISILVILVACLSPFLINQMVNNSYYNITLIQECSYLSERLTMSLYPQIYSSYLTVIKPDGLSFGKYYYDFNYIRHMNTFYGQTFTASHEYVQVRNKKILSGYPYLYDLFSVEMSLFDTANADTESNWNFLTDDTRYYYAYFALTSVENNLEEDIWKCQSTYTTDGQNLTEWIACTVEGSDRIWGISTINRSTVYNNYAGSIVAYRIFHLFMNCANSPKVIEYLSNTKLFGDLSGIDFAQLRDSSRTTSQVVGLMMYGTGAQLKEFKNNDELVLVKIGY